MENKKAITKMSKIIISGQAILVLGFFLFVILFAPRLEYPKNGETIEQKNINFEFRNANVILIDDNEDFSSPVKINPGEADFSKLLFKPGTYYWKAIGIVESSPRRFTIGSSVGLELDEKNRTLENVGNTILNVSLESDSGTEGLVILDINVEYPVNSENKTVYRGEQYEK